jgi:hypothetical protein
MKQLVLIIIVAVMSMAFTCPVFAGEWVSCASENQDCIVPGTKKVNYGAGNRWVSKMVKHKVYCANEVFGDPAPGVVKACYYQEASFLDESGRNHAYRPHWEKCAAEGQDCRFHGQKNVRYGAGDRWFSQTARNGVHCGNNVFGDPAPGAVKACYYQEASFSDESGRNHYRPHWEKCAAEGQNCRFHGQKDVRYGAGDRWSSKTARDGIHCGNNVFGDPVPGVEKACYIRVD